MKRLDILTRRTRRTINIFIPFPSPTVDEADVSDDLVVPAEVDDSSDGSSGIGQGSGIRGRGHRGRREWTIDSEIIYCVVH